MDDDEIPHGMTRQEWSELAPHDRLALLLVNDPPPLEVGERAQQAYDDWQARRRT